MIDTRLNPQWFLNDSTPTLYLEQVYAQLAHYLASKLNPFRLIKTIDVSSIDIYVVGSNAVGRWRSSADNAKLELLLHTPHDQLRSADIEYLTFFYESCAVDAAVTSGDIASLIHETHVVSDLDLKIVKDFSSSKNWSLNQKLLSFHTQEIPKSMFWNGDIHIFLCDQLVPPYFHLNDKTWVVDGQYAKG